MGKHNHRVIIGHMRSHGDFFQMFAAAYGKRYIPFLVQDIDRTEGPAIGFDCLSMIFRRISLALIKRIGFND